MRDLWSLPSLPNSPVNRQYQADQALLAILEQAGLPRKIIARAWFEAFLTRASLLDALCAGGFVAEREIVALLADHFDMPIASPLSDEALPNAPFELAVRAGVMRLKNGAIAIAPRGRGLVVLLEALKTPRRGSPVMLITRQDLTSLALRANGRQIVHRATQALFETMPHFSARRLLTLRQMALAGLVLFGLGCLLTLGERLRMLIEVLATLVFFALSWLRLLACLMKPPTETVKAFEAHELPTYTILVPLFREDAALQGLLIALQNLDYPRTKLDVKFLIEERDAQTTAALESIRVPDWIEIVSIPHGAQRTKPRALNVGLSLAKGEFLVVYDAEDRPEAGQLRRALSHFANADSCLAVAQAWLVIDPRQKGFLPCHFRLEYAGLFCVLLPALARLGYPVPLGGTSNHFRTEVLREIGGWDAFNVTEDADIGLRLHRLGYRATVFSSQTEEEAPSTLGAWLKQRSRWFKGWMVTFVVHMRDPKSLYAQCGLVGSLAFFVLTSGIILSALLEPWCLIALLSYGVTQGLPAAKTEFGEALLFAAFAVTMAGGHLAAVAVILAGCRRLNHRLDWWTLSFVFLYWIFISLAAYRALMQVFFDPHSWEKTAHLLARVPREAKDKGATTLETARF